MGASVSAKGTVGMFSTFTLLLLFLFFPLVDEEPDFFGSKLSFKTPDEEQEKLSTTWL